MDEYTRKIRDHINQARQQDVLMRDRGRWFQLTSSLDVLEDTELAIDGYLATTFERGGGSVYLATYGLLQALVLQQDAAFHAQEVLMSTAPVFRDFKEFRAKYPRLEEIRQIRNVSIGHPTKADRLRPVRYAYISRISMHRHGFTLLISSDAGDTESRDIAITDLIADQRRDIADLLAGVVAALEQADAAHREAFKMDRLAAIFEGTLGYMFEKVYEGVRRGKLADLGATCLDDIRERLTRLQAALERRGSSLDTYGAIGQIYQETAYPLAELGRYLRPAPDDEVTRINQQTAEIFVFFLRHKFRAVREMAQEIDDDYAS